MLLLALAFLLELVLKHVHRRHRADGHLQVYRWVVTADYKAVVQGSLASCINARLTATSLWMPSMQCMRTAVRCGMSINFLCVMVQAHKGACKIPIPNRQCRDCHLHAGFSLARAAPVAGERTRCWKSALYMKCNDRGVNQAEHLLRECFILTAVYCCCWQVRQWLLLTAIAGAQAAATAGWATVYCVRVWHHNHGEGWPDAESDLRHGWSAWDHMGRRCTKHNWMTGLLQSTLPAAIDITCPCLPAARVETPCSASLFSVATIAQRQTCWMFHLQ